MLDGSSLIINEEVLLTLCNDIIIENKKIEEETCSNNICLKMLDYLMF